ncbi:dynein regulatory complex subunit 4-like [Scomber scombrus]|uniref:dynein regulatory complex subunit 4-like n=1 Tax=Scomber scombrus TaxID=13677 RepID=UPI002DDA04A5|nr:dynein regulatory complex subunit 4-like [Scomber scombrus]
MRRWGRRYVTRVKVRPMDAAKGKKGAKARTPSPIDGLTMEEMPIEQLKERILRRNEELDRGMTMNNYYMLGRNKIDTMRAIAERELEELKAKCKNLDKETETDDRHRLAEMKEHKQNLRRLLCEHQNTISELKADGLTSTDAVQKQQVRLGHEHHKMMEGIRVDTQELDIESIVKEMELKHEAEMTKTRNIWELQLAEISAKNEKKMEEEQQQLDNTRKSVTSEQQDLFYNHIGTLFRQHASLLDDFNVLQKDKEQDEAKIRSMKANKYLNPVEPVNDDMKDNRHLHNILLALKDDTEAAFSDIAEFEQRRKERIDQGERIEKAKEKELADRKKDVEALRKKLSELQLEKEQQDKLSDENIRRAQQKADMKIMLLTKKLKAVTDDLEKTQTQLSSVLSDSNIDQTALLGITNKIEGDISSCDDSIKNFRNMKVKISEAYKELLLIHEAKQRTVGVFV